MIDSSLPADRAGIIRLAGVEPATSGNRLGTVQPEPLPLGYKRTNLNYRLLDFNYSTKEGAHAGFLRLRSL
jgi:hypothetical protein